jgi:hypothetical protein
MGGGCASFKRYRHTATTSSDTVKTTIHDTATKDSIRIERIVIRDTIITTPAATAAQTITPSQLVPGASYHTKSGNATATTTVGKDGGIHVTCDCDSVKTVVRNLIERNTWLEKNARQSNSSTTAKSSRTAATHTEKTTVKTTWLGRNWWWLIGIVIVLFAAGELYYNYGLKRKTNRPF